MHSGFTNHFIIIFVIIIIKIKKLVKVVFYGEDVYIDNALIFWMIHARLEYCFFFFFFFLIFTSLKFYFV
jgi:hypothetical protein